MTEASLEDVRSWVPPEVPVQTGYQLFEASFRVRSGPHGPSVADPERTARLTLAVPISAGPHPVVLHAPGTTGVSSECGVVGTEWGAGLAATYGARGMLGAVVDEPGLGSRDPFVYLSAEASAASILQALAVIKDFARSEDIDIDPKFGLTGFSRGGHAVLSALAAAPVSAPDLDLRAAAVVAPATAWEEHWRPGFMLAGEHLLYHTMLVWTWRSAYGALGIPSPWREGLRASIDRWMGERCAFPPPGAVGLNGRLPLAPEALFEPAFLADVLDSDPSTARFMAAGFERNRLRPFESDVPILLYQGDRDSVVPRVYTDQLVESLRPQAQIDYRIVSEGEHTDIAFGFLAVPQRRSDEGIQWLQSHLSH